MAVWHAKATGGYGRTSQEAYDNAVMIYAVLNNLGWSLEAVCGVLGNMEAESGYNPWRWQNDNILATTDTYELEHQTYHAYGMVQFDPASKYIYNARTYGGYGPNFSNRVGSTFDGQAQITYINDNADYFINPLHPEYNLTYEQYKVVSIYDHTIDWITRCWFWNYERGTWSDNRTSAAQYWWTVLGGITPPDPPTPPGTRTIPIWLLFKLKEGNSTNV